MDSGTAADRDLAAGVSAGLERLIGLFRWISPPSGLSLTAAATLATLERSGPRRLTALAAREGVTQPAMTQLVARLQESGLVERVADPADGRVVQVRITAEGQALLAGRRAVRAERVAVLLARLSPDEQAALAAALPAMDALANAQRDEPLAGQPSGTPPDGSADDGPGLAGPGSDPAERSTGMSRTAAAGAASPFRQPKAVFAVAFACVVSFMGIGLVDPILPSISHELHASPSQVTLLFTSYLVVTAVAMLITNWVSSRIGAKKTLILGLALIVVFSAAAGASPHRRHHRLPSGRGAEDLR